jgi:PilZ domain
MFQDTTPVPDPRRKNQRMSAVLAVELSSKEKAHRCGVTRNASEKGLLIVTPSRFAVGDELALSVLLGSQHGQVGARVVRVEENDLASAEVWRYRLAVELDGKLPEALLDEARARSGC